MKVMLLVDLRPGAILRVLGGIVVAVVFIAAAGQIKERPNSGCIVEADRNPAAEG
jgi:hypothetical protein